MENVVAIENIEAKVAELLGQMTLEEKVALTIGDGAWRSHGVERLGVPSITLNDGPHGVRKPTDEHHVGIGTSLPATCFPPAAALAASWDTALAAEIGRALGDESLALDVQVLLGPGVNLKRTPLGGRNFEYFSEDPVLAGEMGRSVGARHPKQGHCYVAQTLRLQQSRVRAHDHQRRD